MRKYLNIYAIVSTGIIYPIYGKYYYGSDHYGNTISSNHCYMKHISCSSQTLNIVQHLGMYNIAVSS